MSVHLLIKLRARVAHDLPDRRNDDDRRRYREILCRRSEAKRLLKRMKDWRRQVRMQVPALIAHH